MNKSNEFNHEKELSASNTHIAKALAELRNKIETAQEELQVLQAKLESHNNGESITVSRDFIDNLNTAINNAQKLNTETMQFITSTTK